MSKRDTISQDDPSDNGKKGQAALEIARYVLKPTAEELPGMTRLPLDQVRPCSFARVFAKEMIEMCKLARYSQELYSKNWEKWHNNDLVIDGVFRRIPPNPDYKPTPKPSILDRLQMIFLGRKPERLKVKEDDGNGKDGKARAFNFAKNDSVINVKTDPRFVIPKINNTIEYEFTLQYYQHRRSTTPDFSMAATELASRQIESKALEEDEGEGAAVIRYSQDRK